MKQSIVELLTKALMDQQKLLGGDATILDAARAFRARSVESFRIRWAATNNPIWIWRCLARQNSLAINVVNAFPDLVGQSLGDMPTWCNNYIVDVSYKIEALASGRDFKEPGALDEATETSRPRTLAPTQAPPRVPAALGLVREGWNAFKEYESEDVPRLFLAGC